VAMMVLSWTKLVYYDDATRTKQLTKAMQNTDRHSAMVIAVSFHLVGYSKPSSSSDALACELRLDVFSFTAFFSSAMIDSAAIGSAAFTDAAAEGMTLSTTFGFSRIDGSWLCVAVLSESAMLDGLRWVLVSVMCLCCEGGPCVPCLSLQVCTV
jgi:hypothetical protein